MTTCLLKQRYRYCDGPQWMTDYCLLILTVLEDPNWKTAHMVEANIQHWLSNSG